MPSQQNSVGLLDQAEVQHQTIKVCVLGKRSCGKSKVIQALAGNVSGPPCQTLGLQVTTCWWGGAQQGLFEQTCTRSLYEFWEVGSAGYSQDSSLLAAAKHSAAVALLVVSMSDRSGFSGLAASVAELQPIPCIVIATKMDAVQSWAMTLADVNRMAKEQKLPVYLMGMTSTGSSGAIDSQAKLGIHPTMDCVQTAVMSQILSSANASLW